MAGENTPSTTLPGFTLPVVETRPSSRMYNKVLNPNEQLDADEDPDHLLPPKALRNNLSLLTAASSQKPADEDPRPSTVLVSKKPMSIFGNEDNATVYTLREPEKADTAPNGNTATQTPPQTVTPTSSTSTTTTIGGMGNWASILQGHSDGKSDFSWIKPEFGVKAASTLVQLDEFDNGRFKGQYQIISACRDEAKQEGLIKGYSMHDASGKFVGYSHVVGAATGENRSEHIDGCALDIVFTGNPKDKDLFYKTYHDFAKANGLELVANDKEHMQLAHSEVLEIRRRSAGTTQLASSKKSNKEEFAFHA